MLLLCLDTSTSAVSVALHDGQRPLAERATIDARRHAELLAPAIAEVLQECGADAGDVTGVACGVGPGPYTGLRVGLATARAFGYARGVAVTGVCSLDVLAYQAYCTDPDLTSLLVASDARRKEVYWARYQQESRLPVRTGNAAVGRAGDIPPALRELPTAGRGPLLWPVELPNALAEMDVSAAALGSLVARRSAGDGELLDPEPLYLRRPDATPLSSRKAIW